MMEFTRLQKENKVLFLETMKIIALRSLVVKDIEWSVFSVEKEKHGLLLCFGVVIRTG